MDKKTILALVLTMALIFIFQTYFMPTKAPVPAKPSPTQSSRESIGKKTEQFPKTEPRKTAPGINGPAGEKTDQSAAKTIVVETPFLRMRLSDVGGGITGVELKKYKATVKGTNDKEIIENIKPYFYMPAVFQQTSPTSTAGDSTRFTANREHITVTDKKEQLVLTGTLENGAKITKTYLFHPDVYTIDFTVQCDQPAGKSTFYDLAVIDSKKESSYTFKGPFVFNGKSLEQFETEKIKEPKSFSGSAYTYAGFDNGYFAFIWIPNADSKADLTILKTEKTPVIRLGTDKTTLSGKFYFGPKKSDILQSLNVRAEKIIDFGWFDVIAKPMVMGLNFSNKLTHNYGIDIILLTILIKLIFHPLSVKSYKSMKKMQEAKTEIDKLKDKYGDDKQKLNQEMMEYYRSRGINPMGGCLPMIIQIPVFFALYKGLSGAIELRHAPFFAWINDLSAPEDLFSFAVAGFTVPIRLLPLIMGVTQFIQQKMTPSMSADPMQEKMMLFMPVIFTFMFWGFPSGLVLYWLVNNVISIGQQYYINKTVK